MSVSADEVANLLEYNKFAHVDSNAPEFRDLEERFRRIKGSQVSNEVRYGILLQIYKELDDMIRDGTVKMRYTHPITGPVVRVIEKYHEYADDKNPPDDSNPKNEKFWNYYERLNKDQIYKVGKEAGILEHAQEADEFLQLLEKIDDYQTEMRNSRYDAGILSERLENVFDEGTIQQMNEEADRIHAMFQDHEFWSHELDPRVDARNEDMQAPVILEAEG